MTESPPRPRCIPVFRALGAVSALAAGGLALAGVGLLLGLGAGSDTATGAVLLGLGALAGFASAMLLGFAANLEILHDIRARQPQAPSDENRPG
ncbi:hypothetical protein CKO28_17745 [Rhodovibrio sodomensis]|uniref:Uncharacterized protein n=1 Tax=Rhodovibrio sodomensis TaxID=1088 RepID=A0ABS1DHC6_9PROT|nr:hypothetical protein [Rhodovibrio sodomensis]MBK1669882.1 hypothetical protein [Rhodovibrio sodomensis]